MMEVGPNAWYDITWVDWVAVVGVLAALVGLYLTWREARKAATSAEATRLAVTQTEVQLRANQLLILLPQLRALALELDAAIDLEQAI